MSPHDYESFDGLGLAKLIAGGETTSGEVLKAAIALIEARNPVYNAVVVKFYEEARRREAAGLPPGPFHGVPCLLKDFGALYAGQRYTCGSRLLENFVADHDSEVVLRYKRAGLAILGRTNMPNFGPSGTTDSKAYGPARNPWNPARMAGGSTGGGAVAVATGMVPIAHGSDAAGSLRLPASHCGLFTLKTSRGRLSPAPDTGEWAGSLGTTHVITRSVRDSAAMLDATHGPAPGDPYYPPPPAASFLAAASRDPAPQRIAFTVRSPAGNAVDPECVAATMDAARLCESLGHTVEEAAPNFDFHRMISDLTVVHGANMWAMIRGLLEKLGREPRPEEIEPAVLAWADVGRTRSAADYAEALKGLHRTGREIGAFFQSYDLLLSPVAAHPPLPLGRIDMMERDIDKYARNMFAHMAFLPQFNCSGQPAIAVPLHWTPDGLPVGVQFVARYADEERLFAIAGQLERARPWNRRRPQLIADAVAE